MNSFVKVPCYANSSQFVTITNRAWFLVNLYVLAQAPTAVHVFRPAKLQALIPRCYQIRTSPRVFP